MPVVREFRQVGKPSELISGLEKLWGQDKLVERNLRRAKIALIISAIALFPSLFTLPTDFFWVVLLTAPAALVSGGLWWHYHRLNLDDRKILAPIKFLEVLQADIPPRSPVRLMVNFEGYRKHGRRLAQTGGILASTKRSRYEDTWLEAEGWLAEKTRFRLAVTQRVSLAEKRKRKYTKRKERVREAVSLQLRPNRKLYPALDCFPAQFAAVAGMRVEAARAAGRSVLLMAASDLYTKLSGRGSQETGMEHLVNGDKRLLLMATAFERLNRCRGAEAA